MTCGDNAAHAKAITQHRDLKTREFMRFSSANQAERPDEGWLIFEH
jgi:hypothetical protein